MPQRQVQANYEVTIRIDVTASSPMHAATVARDMLLDPSTQFDADVHPIEWYEPADEYLPNYDHGWNARFVGGVRPDHVFGFERLRNK